MDTTYDFTDRTAVVTGAAKGIGAAIAGMLHDSGARVVALDLETGGLDELWGADDRVMVAKADVADPSRCARVIEETLDWSGHVDVLVNNAGITRDSVVWKMSDDDWRAVIDVHLTGAFNLIRSVVPPMRAAGYGRIVNMTSSSGMHGNIGQANYSAAKAGLLGLTRTVAREVASFGITVNALAPAAETDMVAGIPPTQKEQLVRRIPIGRMGTTDEMARAVAFLASEGSGYITGATLPVDGGLAM